MKGRNAKNWRADSDGFRMSDNRPPEFEPGIADFVPGWFMQGHMVDIMFLELF